MQNVKLLKRIMALMLIFTLTFSNFALVSKAYASSFTDMIFGERSDTGSKNVSFEAFFETAEDGNVDSIISDVNNDELGINLDLMVENSGYLKDGQIEIKETEEGKGLNFRIKQFEELPEMVQGLEDNILRLNQIVSSDDLLEIVLPIEYVNEEFFDESNLSKNFLVCFSGIYVDGKGNEKELFKEVELNLAWTDERESKIETEVEKYIDFGEGVILQTKIKVDSTVEEEENTLPIKQTELKIEVPKYQDTLPSNINVVANSTEGTNGKGYGETDFSESNWTYDEDENVIKVLVNNESEYVDVSINEDEYIQEIDENAIEELRYYNKPGVDEFLVTYTYENVEITDEEVLADTSIEQTTTILSGAEEDSKESIITNTENAEYVLKEKTGDIVSILAEVGTASESKAYFYANKNNEVYDIDIESKTIVNVSYKDIVENIEVEDTKNSYVDKDGNTYENSDIYYKSISVDYLNFLDILGEDGIIEILDESGSIIDTISDEDDVTEEGKFVLNLDGNYTKLKFRLSTPIKEGNIVIGTIKTIRGISINKEQITKLDSIESSSRVSAKYNYVEDLVEVGEAVTSTELEDTETMGTVSLDRNTLSTTELNENVEIRIELNNAREESDLYGHSEFEIEFPEYVENIEIIESNLIYGEGLEIKSVDVNGRNIRVVLDGVQEGINSGKLTNGTTILLNANIKVDLFTPTTTGLIKLKTVNNEATNYNNEGKAEALINFLSPSGVVAVNSIYNYNGEGTYITSVRQGEKKGIIDVYSTAKVVIEEIAIINNNSNEISDFIILGRFPFEGVKDILNGDNLKTTLTPRITRGVIGDERNNGTFKIYYSENDEATKELDELANNWTENPETFENIRSYLIVPENEDYVLNQAEVLRFTYEYEIPEKLPHNEDINSTFVAYYRNILEYASTNEEVVPDRVGLTTLAGPELDLQITTDKERVKENESVEVTFKVTNIGDSYAEDVELEIPKQSGTQYVSYEVENGVTNWIDETESANVKIRETAENMVEISRQNKLKQKNEWPFIVENSRLEPGETIETKVVFKVGEIDRESKEEKETKYVYEIPEGEDASRYEAQTYQIEHMDKNGEISQTLTVYKYIWSEEELNYVISFSGNATAKDLGTKITKDSNKVIVDESEIRVSETRNGERDILKEGEMETFFTTITNKKAETINNIKATKELSNNFNFIDAYIVKNGEYSNPVGYGNFNIETRQVEWDIGEIEENGYVTLVLKVEANNIEEQLSLAKEKLMTIVTGDGIDTYTSTPMIIYIGQPILEITQESTSDNSVIKEGDKINYKFIIKNTGSVSADNIQLADRMPNGVYASSMSYDINGKQTRSSIKSREEVVVKTQLYPNEILTVNVGAIAGNIDEEIKAVNKGNVSADSAQTAESNEVIHIIEPKEDEVVKSKSYDPSSSKSTIAGGTGNKKYSISGLVWLDMNRDGSRTSEETKMSGISVKLVNSADGMIKQTKTTESNGSYTFSNVEPGSYIVLIDYDSEKYKVTDYKKSGIASNANSDFYTVDVNQDGKTRKAAATDTITISEGSATGIDLGLVLADIFDLEIDKTITKVTTQTSKGTETENYNNVKLAKTEIAVKNLTGSTVFVEYEIKVTNIGDVKGFAKKIVDYIPEGMTFNSSLGENSKWYTGKDGNLYTEEFANKELAKGQSATIKLILTMQMTKENTDIISNIVEIYEDYNKNGIEDINSKAGNKAQGENDLSSADIAILVKTGESLIYASVIMTTAILGIIVVFVAYTKITSRRKKIIE